MCMSLRMLSIKSFSSRTHEPGLLPQHVLYSHREVMHHWTLSFLSLLLQGFLVFIILYNIYRGRQLRNSWFLNPHTWQKRSVRDRSRRPDLIPVM